MEKGEVIYYNNHPERQYGFIKPEGSTGTREENVFFHLCRKAIFYCDGSDMPLHNPVPVDDNGNVIEGQIGEGGEPRMGDVVLFECREGRKGFTVTYWGFLAQYNEVLQQIANRPNYRLRQRNGVMPISKLQEKPTYRTLWEGKDLADLRRRYPKQMYSACVTHEEYEASDNRREVLYFVVWDEESKNWFTCDDPR